MPKFYGRISRRVLSIRLILLKIKIVDSIFIMRLPIDFDRRSVKGSDSREAGNVSQSLKKTACCAFVLEPAGREHGRRVSPPEERRRTTALAIVYRSKRPVRKKAMI